MRWAVGAVWGYSSPHSTQVSLAASALGGVDDEGTPAEGLLA